MIESPAPRKGMSLPSKILLGLILGAICGVIVNQTRQHIDRAVTRLFGEEHLIVVQDGKEYFPRVIVDPVLTNVMAPLGQIFLNMLFMTVVPLVLCSLAVGVAQLGDLRQLGRIGAKTMGYFLLTTTTAVIIGLSLVNVLAPGKNIDAETQKELSAQFQSQAAQREQAEIGVDLFVRMVPPNIVDAMVKMNMLGIIFFALLIGIGLTAIDRDRAKAVMQVLEGVGDLMVFIIGVAMRLAPYAVFALIFRATATLGFGFMQSLLMYILIVVSGLLLQMFVVYPVLLRTLGGVSPWWFFRRTGQVIVTAFSTSSSNATLPASMKAAHENLGIPRRVVGFVLPLGATMNMNGTALFEGVTVLFLAQVFGVDLNLSQQCLVVLLSVLTAIGAAGVPGGSIPLLMTVLAAVGVEPTGIALILGVDRILDMCRTTVNVMGDVTAAVFVARTEGVSLGDSPPSFPPHVDAPTHPDTTA